MKGFLKTFALFAAGVGVSILVGGLVGGTSWPTPGSFLVRKLFPPWTPPPHPWTFRDVLLVQIGTDSICCFVLLWIAYGLFRRVSRAVKK
jgi:hypothetical protein